MTDQSADYAFVRHANGQVDDVAISCDTFRLEQMSDDAWWAAAYRGDERVCFCLRWDRKRKRIVATVLEDSIGCVDDSKEEVPS